MAAPAARGDRCERGREREHDDGRGGEQEHRDQGSHCLKMAGASATERRSTSDWLRDHARAVAPPTRGIASMQSQVGGRLRAPAEPG